MFGTQVAKPATNGPSTSLYCPLRRPQTMSMSGSCAAIDIIFTIEETQGHAITTTDLTI
jgi:hypothetical protein